MKHVLVTLELIIMPLSDRDTMQGSAEVLKKQYEEGAISAEDLIIMATSVTPTFEGVEK